MDLTAEPWKTLLGTFGPLLTGLIAIIVAGLREKPAWVPGWIYREKTAALDAALRTINDLRAANDRTTEILADLLAAVRAPTSPSDPSVLPVPPVRQHRSTKSGG